MKKTFLIVMVLCIIFAYLVQLVIAEEPAAEKPARELREQEKGLLQVLVDNANTAADFLTSRSEDAINRIKAAILPNLGGSNVDSFLASPGTKKARAVAIAKSSDKLILARRENGVIDHAAISIIRYQGIDVDVCQKIDKLPAGDRKLVNCFKDPGRGFNIIKTTTTNRELWHQLVSLVQLR